MKRIAICFDGTWNRPEENIGEDFPTNVLQFARAIQPTDGRGIEQVVFYDWGIGSYHDQILAGATGQGLEKNVMDGYRFLVHNYAPGDEIFLFGFSRGAYTARSLCGMINNCSILKKVHANQIENAFKLYKTKKHSANGEHSMAWKKTHSVEQRTPIKFVGVWDTVGALGLPFTFFGLIKDKDLFYDREIGNNVETARHALSLDEHRKDFEPTLWDPKEGTDIKQVWFAGAHSDVGGGYGPDKKDRILANIPLLWMAEEAKKQKLTFHDNLPTQTFATAEQHNEYKGKYRLLGKLVRDIPALEVNKTWVHSSVKGRYTSGYKSESIERFVKTHGKWPPLWD
ncbi:DUF2235 domain-containing protein [Marinobacter halophilus]|uniref:T6SS Phospholipase effector Tle1-like catalytic domain-containing protein n=1 Tax=Marinobacter halophilus TaxID=1323740 RepID=A0A2T1KBN0_9GAMM|nr:DUF2235 domain-containing protein [Marinobacter halophilus]PSF06942.1 hypothetical protein C7H08_17930 [Marinobacter halophilus]GGC76874.1 hypothetical protein GCM10011362_26880 [Marinobacter halophilus]